MENKKPINMEKNNKNLNNQPIKNENINLNEKELENKKLEEIAERILTEYKYAFEVLGNGDIWRRKNINF